MSARNSFCWWCGDPADSREHRAKATDVKALFGPPPYFGDQTLNVWGTDRGGETPGVNSNLLKYQQTMCKACNGDRSQPFDAAWTKFITFVISIEEAVLGARKIHLEEVYGTQWQEQGSNLVKFFVKQICCVIAERDDTEIPEELIAFLNGSPEPSSLRFQFAVDENAWQFIRWLRSNPNDSDQSDGIMFMGNSTGRKDPRTNVIVNIYGRYMVSWMCVLWEFDATRDFPATFDSPLIELDTVHLAFEKGPRPALKFRAAVEAVEHGELPKLDEDIDEFLERLNLSL